MSVRLIKKYSNRRLYDTQESCYINTDDLRKMIIGFENISVVDAKTGEDITPATVIQIIGELEAQADQKILTKEILFQLVRLYGNPMGAGFAEYFEKSLDIYVRQREFLRDQMQRLINANPLNFMEQMTVNPMKMWEEMSNPFSDKKSSTQEPGAEKSGAPPAIRYNPLKILVISDKISDNLYQTFNRGLFQDISFVISCGDLPAYYLNYIVDMLDVPCFYVPGNHDERFISEPPMGWTPIQNKIISHKGVRIAGMGGSPWYNGKSPYQYHEAQVFWDVQKMRARLLWTRSVDILATHSPAYDLGDIKNSRTHSGFKSYRQFLDKHSPKLFVYGHAHISYGAPRTLEYRSTVLINAFNYWIIDWDEICRRSERLEHKLEL
ncbi:hypothetical protein CHS0354_013135 [Potamilus streckersoni]|uniref:Calcineurin-like phosphoesterase domain-containing protein n=1 Tax=Potamilus streckersoni TaxID=2493646 RepID=A0AAE0VRB5_9BIVA|nr:hypothetical protein CHS0354_013135 [Potamilus streckersoni]